MHRDGRGRHRRGRGGLRFFGVLHWAIGGAESHRVYSLASVFSRVTSFGTRVGHLTQRRRCVVRLFFEPPLLFHLKVSL